MPVSLATLGQFRIGTTEYAAGRARSINEWHFVRKQYGDNSSTYSYGKVFSKADYKTVRANPDAFTGWQDEDYSNIDYQLLLLPMATPLPTSTASTGPTPMPTEGTATAAGISTEAAQDKQIALLQQLITQPAPPAGDRATETTLAAVYQQLVGTLRVGVDGQVSIANFPSGFHVTVDNPTAGLTNDQLRAGPVAVAGAFFQATQPVSLAAVPLAPNAATAALQMAGNSALSDISSKLGGSLTVTFPAVQHVVVDNQPTTLAISNFPATQPVSLASNTPDVTDRAARLLGHVTVDNQPSSLTVSNFPATQAVTFAAPQHVIVDNQPAAVANQRVTVDNPTTTVAVSNLPVTQAVSLATNTPDVTDRAARILGHVTVDNQPTALAVNNFPTTQPISAASLPLPTGAATAALQTTGNTSVASIDGKVSTAALQTSAISYLQTIATNTATGPKAAGGLANKVVVANAASTTPTVIKATAGQLYHIGIGNTGTAVMYVSFYNKATAPASGDIPVEIHPIPAGSYVSIDYTLGNQYSTGISLTITSNLTLLGTLTGLLVANQVVVNVAYA